MVWRLSNATRARLARSALCALACAAGACGRREAAAPPADSGLALVGYLQGAGVDPGLCEARCTSLRFEPRPAVLRARLDGQGHFEFRGLADLDYAVEVVARENPALVVARVDFVRPSAEALVLDADPAHLFGAAASVESSSP